MQDAKKMLPNGKIIRKHYRIERLIGGTTSPVYLVQDERTKEHAPRALKDMGGLDEQERFEFAFEGMALCKLRHPALPEVYDVLRDEKRERVYIVMEYVKGVDLETLWRQQPKQRYTWQEVRELLSPIVDALQYMHQQYPPILHQDIKPVNIIMAADGHPRLVDIGVARAGHSNMSVDERLSSYKAPESYLLDSGTIVRTPDKRADIYGLAATCYALLTGTPPPSSLERLVQVEQGKGDPLKAAHKIVRTIPRSVSTALQQALSLEPSRRFASMKKFWEAMNAVEPRDERHKLLRMFSIPEKRPVYFSTKGIILMLVTIALLLSAVPFVTNASSMSLLSKHTPFPLTASHLSVASPTVGKARAVPTTASRRAAATATVRKVSPSPTAIPRNALPTPTSGATTSSANATPYTSIAGVHVGTIYDLATNTSTTIAITIRQQQESLRGTIVLGPKVQGSGSFIGTIDRSQSIHLYVVDAQGKTVLFLEGSVQSSSSISGDYYSCTPSSNATMCHRANDNYGLWNTLTVR